MKKLLLIPALLAATLAFSEQKNYEISPMIEYDYHEPSLGFKDDGYYLGAGAGAKVNFTQNLALKLEAIYLGKIATHNDGVLDHNLIALVGLTYAFGEKTPQSVETQAVEPEPIPEPTPKAKKAAVAAPVIVDGDDDKDGIPNSKDSCPTTPTGVTKGCNVDNDGDGVLNSADICPNTPIDEVVNSDGCPKTILLHINFENNSDEIKSSSDAYLQAYADFLIQHKNYSAKIIGYTDSRGSASYNQALSEKRANAVVAVLVTKGVEAKQLVAYRKR